MSQKKNEHILIVRFSAMGDVVMVSHVVRMLRIGNPDLKITILTRPFFQPFFRDIDGVNFFSPDLNGRHKGITGMLLLYKDLLSQGITHVADLHNVLRTKLLRRLFVITGKKVTVLDKGRDDKRILTRKFRKEMVQLKPTVERYRETISALGFEIPDIELPSGGALPVPPEIAAIAGDKTGRWIGVAPFALHKGKIYPPELMTEVVRMLGERYEKIFIFGGGPYEQEFAECLAERFSNVVSVIGRIKLGQELDLISNLDAMVSMDSSAMHMASLMGIPAVSIWGATHPYAGFYGFGQNPDLAVQLDLPCRPCSVYGNKECHLGDYRCMHGIAPESIVEKVDALLAGNQN